MQDDFGDQYEEDNKGRAKDNMVEIEDGSLVRSSGMIRRALGGKEELPDDWTTTANVVWGTARKVLGVSSKQMTEDKETWWWYKEVQESIRKKRSAKKRWG